MADNLPQFDPDRLNALKQAAPQSTPPTPPAAPQFDPSKFASVKRQATMDETANNISSGVGDFFKPMPRAVAQGWSDFMALAGKQAASDPETAAAVAQYGRQNPDISTLPTSKDIMGGIQSVTGELPKPRGMAGEFGGALAETATNPLTYLGPGGLPAKLIMGGASALGSEAAGQAVKGSAAEPWARLAGGLMAGPTAARVMRPELSADAQALVNAGVPLTPGQMFGKTAKSIEDRLTSIPGVGDLIKNAQRKGIDAWNVLMGNRVLAPIGETVPAGTKAGHETMQVVGDKIGDAYDTLLPRLQWTPDSQYARDMLNIRRGPVATLDDPLQKRFDAILNQAFGNKLTTPMSGSDFKKVESELGKRASNYKSSSIASERDLGDAISQAKDAARDVLERANPAHADELGRINTAYAMQTRLQDAAAAQRGAEGVFTPSTLLGAVKKQDRTARKAAFGRGEAMLQPQAESANRVLAPNYPDSGTAGRGIMAGLYGAAIGANEGWLHSPAAMKTLIGLGATATPYTGPGMWALRKYAAQPTNWPDWRTAYATAGRGLGALKPIVTTPYGDNSPFARGGHVNPYAHLPHFDGGGEAGGGDEGGDGGQGGSVAEGGDGPAVGGTGDFGGGLEVGLGDLGTSAAAAAANVGVGVAGNYGGDTSGTGGTGPGAGGMPGTGVGGIGSDSNAAGISANSLEGNNYGGGFNPNTPGVTADGSLGVSGDVPGSVPGETAQEVANSAMQAVGFGLDDNGLGAVAFEPNAMSPNPTGFDASVSATDPNAAAVTATQGFSGNSVALGEQTGGKGDFGGFTNSGINPNTVSGGIMAGGYGLSLADVAAVNAALSGAFNPNAEPNPYAGGALNPAAGFGVAIGGLQGPAGLGFGEHAGTSPGGPSGGAPGPAGLGFGENAGISPGGYGPSGVPAAGTGPAGQGLGLDTGISLADALAATALAGGWGPSPLGGSGNATTGTTPAATPPGPAPNPVEVATPANPPGGYTPGHANDAAHNGVSISDAVGQPSGNGLIGGLSAVTGMSPTAVEAALSGQGGPGPYSYLAHILAMAVATASQQAQQPAPQVGYARGGRIKRAA